MADQRSFLPMNTRSSRTAAMNTRSSRTAVLFVALVSASLALADGDHSGTWTNSHGGIWSEPGNWQFADVATGAGYTAAFGFFFSGSQIDLDTDRTIGVINIAPADGVTPGFESTAGMSLILDSNGSLQPPSSGANAQINFTHAPSFVDRDVNFTIGSVILHSSLDITSTAS